MNNQIIKVTNGNCDYGSYYWNDEIAEMGDGQYIELHAFSDYGGYGENLALAHCNHDAMVAILDKARVKYTVLHGAHGTTIIIVKTHDKRGNELKGYSVADEIIREFDNYPSLNEDGLYEYVEEYTLVNMQWELERVTVEGYDTPEEILWLCSRQATVSEDMDTCQYFDLEEALAHTHVYNEENDTWDMRPIVTALDMETEKSVIGNLTIIRVYNQENKPVARFKHWNIVTAFAMLEQWINERAITDKWLINELLR